MWWLEISTRAVRDISQRFYAMATKEKKKNNSKKGTNKSTGQESVLIEGNTSSQLRDNSISQKLDMLLDVVKGLDAKVQDQDARLQKQEERVSIANVSALLLHTARLRKPLINQTNCRPLKS